MRIDILVPSEGGLETKNMRWLRTSTSNLGLRALHAFWDATPRRVLCNWLNTWRQSTLVKTGHDKRCQRHDDDYLPPLALSCSMAILLQFFG